MIRYISLVVLFFSIIGLAQTQKDLDKLYELDQKGKYSEVINESTRLIKLYPEGANVYYCYYMRGFSYMESENYYKAEPDLKKCVELNPKWVHGLNDLYVLYFETEEYGKAIPLIKKVINMRDKPIDHHDLGFAYFRTNDFQNSIKSYSNYLNTGVGDDEIYFKRLALYERGKAKNSLQKGRGCDDVSSALQKAYVESKYYPSSLYMLEFKSLDYATKNGCITYRTADIYEKAMRKAYKNVFR